MSSVSDPYQPIEAKLKLTRNVLRFMDKRNELMILTKSPLVVRDVDVLRLFPRVEVGLTVNSFEGREKRLFEPLTPIQKARINALKVLHEEGIKNYAFISPIIPGITDVEAIIRETRDFVDWYFLEFLNLRKAGEEFRRILEEEFPESYTLLTDNEKFREYLKNLTGILKRLNAKVEGIETHK
ncbi:Radical SAM domain protein [Thermococcus chitonophagus]|uniref:Radical SAM domain protein n=1 Tax=Thermococcus chitonophagus TaxID=54262 RepID=A0A160VWJ4_9EURY|nr:Radical SAM domain protein [Thermococcus chitonophagus]